MTVLRVIHSAAEEEAYREVGWEGTEYPKVLAWYGAGIPSLPTFERKYDTEIKDQNNPMDTRK